MKTTTKRLFSLLLSVLMVLGVFGLFAYADEIDPNDYEVINYKNDPAECKPNGQGNGLLHDPDNNKNMILVKDYSCTEGLNEFYKLYYCPVCEKTIKKVYDNKVTGKPEIQPHKNEVVIGKPATCTEDGLTNGIACSVCGKVKEEQKVIPADHTDANKDGYCDICKAATRYHCPYCDAEHAGFFGAFVKVFHNILASFGLKK